MISVYLWIELLALRLEAAISIVGRCPTHNPSSLPANGIWRIRRTRGLVDSHIKLYTATLQQSVLYDPEICDSKLDNDSGACGRCKKRQAHVIGFWATGTIQAAYKVAGRCQRWDQHRKTDVRRHLLTAIGAGQISKLMPCNHVIRQSQATNPRFKFNYSCLLCACMRNLAQDPQDSLVLSSGA